KPPQGHFSHRVTVNGGDEPGRPGQDFNHLASTLERNQQMRRDLMADISHELRTPLAVRRGVLEGVPGGGRGLPPPGGPSLR
ncbi:two-component system sensor histidine kinase BaeA, partial [Klebsiella pneumoniae]|nr:two-component system sensor histidine kinase BaeA [Klebsiella pneumoniae]